MDSGKRIALVVLGLAVIGIAAAVLVSYSGEGESEGGKPWEQAVRKQLQMDEKKGGDEDWSSEEGMAKLEAKIDEMVKSGKISAADAAVKREAIQQGVDAKAGGYGKKNWK